jgi:hypothetical protein
MSNNTQLCYSYLAEWMSTLLTIDCILCWKAHSLVAFSTKTDLVQIAYEWCCTSENVACNQDLQCSITKIDVKEGCASYLLNTYSEAPISRVMTTTNA